jgi:hypothetical protein
MVHYTCDLCHRSLEAASGLRYVVRIEVFPALDPPQTEEWEDDRDHLSEVHESLEGNEPEGEQYQDPYQELRFDLCPDCRKRFARDPLGRDVLKQFEFSEN